MSDVTLSVFPDLSGHALNEYSTTFDGFVQWLNDLPEYAAKGDCPLISLNRFGTIRTEKKQSLRHDANILATTGAIGDYDAGAMTPQDAAAVLQAVQIRAVIVTTPSHGIKGQRWRLLLPFEIEQSLERRYSLLAKVNTLLGGVLAGESFTASQAFYIGRVAGVAYSVIAIEGVPVDVNLNIEPLPETGRPMARPRTPGDIDEFALILKRAEGGIDQIREVLSRIANPGHDWEFWNKIGMACYNASSGSDGGLEAWREWSDQCAGDGDSVDDRWEHYASSRPTEIGMGTLVHLAGGLQRAEADNTQADELGAPKLRAASEGQRAYAENVRAAKLAQCGENTELATQLAQGGKTARFWLDNQDRTPEELAGALSTIERTTDPFSVSNTPQVVAGYQFKSPDMQIEHFHGCVYVQDQHCVFTPTGAFLKPDQFKATYGGYVFQLDDSREKTTTNAWTAFTESQLIRFPKAATTIFRPEYETGEIIREEGLSLVNTYVPIETRRIAGDPGRFVRLLEKLLPDPRDREILLSYIAALVQYPGVKFQWWPVLQGVEGNGKSAIIYALTFAVGSRYTHCPNVHEIAKSGNKFNGWIKNRLFIGMEEVYVANRREFLEEFKTTVTNKRLPIENKGVDQIMGDNRANGVMCTNHKDGVPITTDTRRYCILYTAQQTKKDLERDGMTGRYFPDLYDWLEGRNAYEDLGIGYGYAVVNDYLQKYQISDEFNPATNCQTAPVTSSTGEAVAASLGPVEQEILEAIEEGRPGFAGGWISSFALDRLLEAKRVARAIPPNKRRGLLQSLGYDWHPCLKNGRVNNNTVSDAGKPRLFIKFGHISANLQKPAEVVKAYDAAQSVVVEAATAASFGRS